jgi:predicted nucleic acid-binding protein
MEYKRIIIDSSVWIAAFNEEDSNYKKVLKYKDYFEEEQWMPDIVFYEVLSVLKTKIKKKESLDKFIIYAKENGNISIRLFYEDNKDVLRTFTHETSGKLSYVDALLVHLSRKYHILTFDEDVKKQIQKYEGFLIE